MSDERQSHFDHTPLPASTAFDAARFSAPVPIFTDAAPANLGTEANRAVFPTEPKARLIAVVETLKREYAGVGFDRPKAKALIDLNDLVEAESLNETDDTTMIFDRMHASARDSQEYGIAFRHLLKLKNTALEEVEVEDGDSDSGQSTEARTAEPEGDDGYDYTDEDDRFNAFSERLESLVADLYYTPVSV